MQGCLRRRLFVGTLVSVQRLLRHLNLGALLAVVGAASALMMYPSDDGGLLGLPKLEVGQGAPRTIKSPRNFSIRDLDTEARLRVEAIGRVRPVYEHVTGWGTETKRRVEAAFVAAVEARPRTSADSFMRTVRAFYDEDRWKLIRRTGFTDEYRDAAIMIVAKLAPLRIAEDVSGLELGAPDGIQIRVRTPEGSVEHEESALTFGDVVGLDQARAAVDKLVATELGHLEPDIRRAVAVLIKPLLQPNLAYHGDETERRREAVSRAFKPLFISIAANETVLRQGTRVTERDLLLFQGIAGELEARRRIQRPLGGAALIVLMIIALYLFHAGPFRRLRLKQRDLAFGAFVYVLQLLVLYAGYQGVLFGADALPFGEPTAYRALVPLAWAPLLIRFVLGFEAAAAFLPLVAITAGWVMDDSVAHALYALVGGLAIASVRVEGRPRAQLIVAGIWCGLWQAAVVVLYALHRSTLAPSTLVDVGAAITSGLLAALLAAIAVPVVEALFGYTTAMKLSDLGNLNHPLLRELLVQAPGTYHHSIVVGALAETAARQVGADPQLSRVGGYYHDVGKLDSPRTFIENRRTESLLRSDIGAPAPLADDLRRHVVRGMELATKHRLGRAVTEIIEEHHGGGTVRRFGAEFPYTQPKPRTREAALVLLADAVEAAIGTQVAAAPLAEGALEETVGAVIAEAVAAGQLDRCDLTLADLRAVTDGMCEVLRDMLLRRTRPPSTERPVVDPRYVKPPPMSDGPN